MIKAKITDNLSIGDRQPLTLIGSMCYRIGRFHSQDGRGDWPGVRSLKHIFHL